MFGYHHRYNFDWWILLIFMLLALVFTIPICLYYRRRLTKALTRLYQGNLWAFEEFHFMDAQAEQLYFPFTEDELRLVNRCREFTHHDLTVEPLYPLRSWFGGYYFHIACDYQGVDDQYQPFSLQREGYLYVSCHKLRGYWEPCITHVERRDTPFFG